MKSEESDDEHSNGERKSEGIQLVDVAKAEWLKNKVLERKNGENGWYRKLILAKLWIEVIVRSRMLCQSQMHMVNCWVRRRFRTICRNVAQYIDPLCADIEKVVLKAIVYKQGAPYLKCEVIVFMLALRDYVIKQICSNTESLFASLGKVYKQCGSYSQHYGYGAPALYAVNLDESNHRGDRKTATNNTTQQLGTVGAISSKISSGDQAEELSLSTLERNRASTTTQYHV